jgi:hypothetical protein
VQALFDAHKHKTVVTLRKDGSPRISVIETNFVDRNLRLGAMWQSRKALDLRRNPRFTLHIATADADEAWRSDDKIAGRAEEVADAPATLATNQRYRAGEAIDVPVGSSRWLPSVAHTPSS